MGTVGAGGLGEAGADAGQALETDIEKLHAKVEQLIVVPEKAIDRATLFPSNPVFGLNAIGAR
jgi:hypothetical protein